MQSKLIYDARFGRAGARVQKSGEPLIRNGIRLPETAALCNCRVTIVRI